MKRLGLTLILLLAISAPAFGQGITVTASALRGRSSSPAGEACSPSGASSVAVRVYSGIVYLCVSGVYTAAGFSGGAVASAITGPNGTAGAPTFAFTSDADGTGTGIFRSAANVIGFSTNGVERWVINASGAFNPTINNTYDIGNGTVNPRDLNLGRNVVFPDNVRQTFNPGADAAGLNVGSLAGDPGTPANGDIWYDSTANELTARINGASVVLGASSGTVTSVSVVTANGVSGSVATDTTTPAITLTLGAITPTSVNKVVLTAPATGSTLTILDGKTATFNHSITFAGTDSTTQTFPATSQTIAGLAVSSQTFTTDQLIDRAGIAATPTDAAVLTNSTAATGGATLQYSPRLRFHASGWDSDGSASSQDLAFYLIPTTSAAPTSSLAIAYSDNGGAYTTIGTLSRSASTTGLSVLLHPTNGAFVASNAARLFSGGGGARFSNDSTTAASFVQILSAASTTSGYIRFDPSNSAEKMRLDGSGNLLLGTTATATTSAGTLHILDGTAPTASLANGVVIYSAAGEANVRDAAGNVTPFSPHNFSMIPGGRSEELAWSYYSQRDGKYITVDMARVVRLLEKLTGEKLIFTGEVGISRQNPK